MIKKQFKKVWERTIENEMLLELQTKTRRGGGRPERREREKKKKEVLEERKNSPI